MSASPVPASKAPAKSRTAVDLQRAQLDRLLANPAKPVVIPERPANGGLKVLRPPQETIKNVQGSSAGAGSGEFHVYKQSRRREYERLKIMEEEDKRDKVVQEAEQRHAERQALEEAKLAKNRAKRQKKKQRAAKPASTQAADSTNGSKAADDVPFKKRKIVASDGAGFAFRSARDDESDDGGPSLPDAPEQTEEAAVEEAPPAIAPETGISIVDEDD
ncbi:uncharacterized protein L969DRAFT_87740 [Mixia osmundae IAM 14324]|uniref:DUF1168-domain-containing protein n=1 Tax=Mixia osmundae (strain CBS 9802 / IAM 14324 / JCM 22182 / KY 12970) TaxID=764103 RepID=G7E480_MIXOS|nr:uncharacterized protein L969DRAFT_87740 [Mixia osmundae IAM 14324]KEI39736.1 hypothetical protein L969DRAFT_87740 [Mixia osmundae IAM 14324]GAA97640.1 hypothetical protein E5Q_04318 [Mixia osmundae IAM 14324]